MWMDSKLTHKEAQKIKLRSITAPHDVCQKVTKMCKRRDQTVCQDKFRKEYSRTRASAISVCIWRDILSWDIIFSVGTSEHSNKDSWEMKRKMESWEPAHVLRGLWGLAQSPAPWRSSANVSWMNNSKLMVEWRGGRGRRYLLCKMWINKHTSRVRLTQSHIDIYIRMCLQVIWAKVSTWTMILSKKMWIKVNVGRITNRKYTLVPREQRSYFPKALGAAQSTPGNHPGEWADPHSGHLSSQEGAHKSGRVAAWVMSASPSVDIFL